MSNDNSEENICDKCEKKFFSKYTLASHKKKSKTCKEENNEKYQCDYCSKELTTLNNLNRHYLTCSEKERKEFQKKIQKLEKYIEEEKKKYQKESEEEKKKYQKESEEEKKKIEKYQKEFEEEKKKIEKYQKEFEDEKKEYQKQLQDKEQIIISKDILITKLETKLEQMQKLEKQLEDKDKQQLDTIKDLAKTAIEKKTTTTVKNTTVNNVGGDLTLYFNQDVINQKIHSKLTENDLYTGYKGIAEFLKINIATDDNGKLIYFCVDPARQHFCYKDDQGNEVKDLKAQKMIALIKTAMQERIAAIYEEQCRKQTRLLEEKADLNGREMQMCEFAIQKTGKMKTDIYGITDHNKMALEMAKILYQ